MSGFDQPMESEDAGRVSIAGRVQRNIGIVFAGNVAAAALGMTTLALNARSLGLAGLGVLALIMTTATLLQRVFAFQTWLPLINLGSEALETGDRRRLADVTMVALVFDALAAVAAALTAAVIIVVAGVQLGIPREYIGVAVIYMAVLTTAVTDAPTGLLRLLNRFDMLTAVQVGGAVVACALAVSLYVAAAPLTTYILGFAAAAAVTNLLLLTCGLVVASKAGVHLQFKTLNTAWRSVSREFWSFSWVMSLSGTIYAFRDRAAVLLLGAFLGPAAVGLYHVAERIAGVLSMIASAVNHALYPEIARLSSRRRVADLNWAVLRTGAICSGIGLAALLGAIAFGPLVLHAIGGAAYADGYRPLAVLTGAYGVAMAGVALRAAVIVVAGPRTLLIANVIAILGFTLTATAGVIRFGLLGAAAALVVFEVLAISVAGVQYAAMLRREL